MDSAGILIYLFIHVCNRTSKEKEAMNLRGHENRKPWKSSRKEREERK